jgi:hypothetical protein
MAMRRGTTMVPEIVIDAANVGYHMCQHGRSQKNFRAQAIEIALNYFNNGVEDEEDEVECKSEGQKQKATYSDPHKISRKEAPRHRAVAFLPQHFVESREKIHLADDVELLKNLRACGQVVITPARVDDDVFILQYAALHGCTVVSNDKFNDHLRNAREGRMGTQEQSKAIIDVILNHTKKYKYVRGQFVPLTKRRNRR